MLEHPDIAHNGFIAAGIADIVIGGGKGLARGLKLPTVLLTS